MVWAFAKLNRRHNALFEAQKLLNEAATHAESTCDAKELLRFAFYFSLRLSVEAERAAAPEPEEPPPPPSPQRQLNPLAERRQQQAEATAQFEAEEVASNPATHFWSL